MKHSDQRLRMAVILVQPENPENIGLVARAMKNTGFENLRLVMPSRPGPKAYKTAVCAQDTLEKALVFSDVEEATSDLDVVFAATAKQRKNFSSLVLEKAVDKIMAFPPQIKIGLLFGNERTGLTSEELRSSNFRMTIPQASAQPSYNLAAAVLLTLFQIFIHNLKQRRPNQEAPLPRREQEKCMQLILDKLEKKKFIHPTNRLHVEDMVYDLFGRLAMTAKDRNFLLALFSKGVDEEKNRRKTWRKKKLRFPFPED